MTSYGLVRQYQPIDVQKLPKIYNVTLIPNNTSTDDIAGTRKFVGFMCKTEHLLLFINQQAQNKENLLDYNLELQNINFIKFDIKQLTAQIFSNHEIILLRIKFELQSDISQFERWIGNILHE